MEPFLSSNCSSSQFIESFVDDLKQALQKIKKIFNEYSISFTVIGGVARNFYAPTRTTEDIDLLVDRKDKQKVKSIPIGIMRDLTGNGKIFNLHVPKARVEILYSGEHAGNISGIPYLPPEVESDNRKNIPILKLESLIKYKLSSGIYGKRYKDFGDIQDLITHNNLDITFAKNFRDDLRKKYQEIWKETKEGNL